MKKNGFQPKIVGFLATGAACLQELSPCTTLLLSKF
jgi:hypothetical protein